jgi:molybdopterin-guanine dinucleotide biosynthesis protein A
VTSPLLVGVMVGGRGTRMGGVPKGLLAAPNTGEGLAARLVRLCRVAVPAAEIVLVGDATAYGALGLRALGDEPAGTGPLGGLTALLREGRRLHGAALVLAADLPYVTTDLVARVVAHAPDAAAVAPRPGGFWQPLFARYAPEHCLPHAERLLTGSRWAAHGILDALGEGARILPLGEAEARLLDDWDCPDDVRPR